MPSSVTYEVQGLKEFSDRVNKLDPVIRITLNDGLRAIGRLFVPAKGTGPMANATPRVTGKLARSTFFQILGAPARQVLMILQPARTPEGEFYGEFVREGTRPHIIRPKLAKALKFTIDGTTFFAMAVKHPGSKPNPYHKRVLAILNPQIQGIVNKMGQKITAFLAGK